MTWVVDDGRVTHERLDDEVIAIAFETGVYYSLRGTAAECWSAIAQGNDAEGIAAEVAARYDVAAERAREDVEELLRGLSAEGLIVDSPTEPAPPSVSAGDAEPGARAYEPPTFERFDDMRELLLLDPIHEVDDAGWPVPAPESH